MIQSEFEGLCCSVSISSMADHLGLVVETLDSRISDSHVEVVQDLFLMLSDHPCEVSHGL